MRTLQEDTETVQSIGPFLSVADNVTPVTGLAVDDVDVYFSINGGASIARIGTGWEEDVNGYYLVTFDALDVPTRGNLRVHASDPTVFVPIWEDFRVVGEAEYSQLLQEGHYARRSDIEKIFGKANVRAWADLDNAGDEDDITDRIDWALDLAKERFDNRLRNGPYEIPFTSTNSSSSSSVSSTDGGSIPLEVVDANARYAGVLLYDGRRLVDQEDNQYEMGPHEKKVNQFIRSVLAGQVHFDLTPVVVSYPRTIS